MNSQYVKLAGNQVIELRAKDEATPTQAVNAAIEFAQRNQLRYVDLDYFGYLFGIEPNSDIKQLIADYSYWESIQKSKKPSP